MIRVTLFILICIAPVFCGGQMLIKKGMGISGTLTTYSADTAQNIFRGNMSFSISLVYDSTRNETIVGTRADNASDYDAIIYRYRHGVKDVSQSTIIQTTSTPDNHQRPMVWFKGGSIFASRTLTHNSAFQVYRGEADTLSNIGDIGTGIGYPCPYILNDTIGWIGRYTIGREIHNYKSSPNGASAAYDRDITNVFPSGNQPYPGIFSDWIDGSIIYYVVNTRNYGVGINDINYFELFFIKATDFDTLRNIENTHTSTSSLSYSTLNASYQIAQASDTTAEETRILGGYVDADDDLHAVYSNTSTDSLVFFRASENSYITKNIPIDSKFQNPGTEPSNIIAIDDWADLVHKGGDRYDLFVFNDGWPVYMYSTDDAFDTISEPFQISPAGLQPISMRSTGNWVHGRGWPYVVAISYNYDDGNELLTLYEYYPK